MTAEEFDARLAELLLKLERLEQAVRANQEAIERFVNQQFSVHFHDTETR